MKIVLCTILAAILGVSAAHSEPVLFPGTGHYYDLVIQQVDWEDARSLAEAMSFEDYSGYLATITSAEENEFLNTTFNTGSPGQYAWIGGHEPQDDGVWIWDSGPEAGIQFSSGSTPVAPYFYANWGGIEPNDYAPGEDFAAFNIGLMFANMDPGTWIDSPNPNPADPVIGFFVEFGDDYSHAPTAFSSPVILKQNHPNPFNPSTRIEFALSTDGVVRLSVYDLTGRLVAILVRDEYLEARIHSIVWDGCDDHGRNLASGAYFYRLDAGKFCETKRMVLVK